MSVYQDSFHFSKSSTSSISALAKIPQKSFKGNFTAKIDFPVGMVTIADADIENLKSLICA